MIPYMKTFTCAGITFFVLDYLWLNHIAKKLYVNNMHEVATIQNGDIQITLWAGIIVYIFLALGIVHFVLPLFKPNDSIFNVFLMGAFLGFVIYGVYDFTNLATLKSWPLLLAVIDVGWGSLATGLVALASYKVQNL